jgi:Rps23 Pro-64 3,4-dihydroxylase Tpa1-like proline 4-hydroxylase
LNKNNKFIVSDLEKLAEQYKANYLNANPFPHIVFDGIFNEDYLNLVLSEFPDLQIIKSAKFNNQKEKKFASNGELGMGERTKQLIHFLNSEPFLIFLNKLTGINDLLMPDPYLLGGGLHEIKRGGLLSIHADVNKHPPTGLHRRLNLILYLNKSWKEEYLGSLELWNKNMTKYEARILPIFNRLVIFDTDSDNFHGHPDPLMCPEGWSRKSLALYYYSKENPNKDDAMHDTIFRERPGEALNFPKQNMQVIIFLKKLIIAIMPPILLSLIKRLLNRYKSRKI